MYEVCLEMKTYGLWDWLYRFFSSKAINNAILYKILKIHYFSAIRKFPK
jgi:hypothetical protein